MKETPTEFKLANGSTLYLEEGGSWRIEVNENLKKQKSAIEKKLNLPREERERFEKEVLDLRKQSAGYGFVTDESILMFEKHFVYPLLERAVKEERGKIRKEVENLKFKPDKENPTPLNNEELAYIQGLNNVLALFPKDGDKEG